ncbi:hypothetical protein KM043_016934 [Ampulex compressa]|nr:hypothetical protein KM043_016934 [Ampulex compressa]
MASKTKRNEQELALSLGRQREAMRFLHRIKSNFLALLLERRTSAMVAHRLGLVEKLWADIVEQHVRLAEAYPLETQAELDYFADDHYESALDRLRYLYMSVQGEASEIVRRVPLTAGGFKEAWAALERRYENPRAVVMSLVHQIIQTPTVGSPAFLRCAYCWIPCFGLSPGSDRWVDLCSIGMTGSWVLLSSSWTRKRVLDGKNGLDEDGSCPRLQDLRELCVSLKDDDCLHRTDDGHPLRMSVSACLPCGLQGFSVDGCWRALSRPHCSRCGQAHHALVHSTLFSSNVGGRERSTSAATVGASGEDTPGPSSVTSHSASLAIPPRTFLVTARVRVSSQRGRWRCVRALLDQGSELSLVSESLAHNLRLRRPAAKVDVSGLGESPVSLARGRVLLDLMPAGGGVGVPFKALVLPRLTVYRGHSAVRLEGWEHFTNLSWANPQPSSRDPIEILIGADFYGAVLREDLHQGPTGSTTAQAHVWLGDLRSDSEARRWSPSFRITSLRLAARPDAHSRGGRRRICPVFGSWRRLLLLRSPSWRMINGTRGTLHAHMSGGRTAANSSEIDPLVYLPHHPVLRKGAPLSKLRVVSNASSPSSLDLSLNDRLMVGPKLQADIGGVLNTWRRHEFVFKADIRKMFRQIWVHPRDVDWQRVL